MAGEAVSANAVESGDRAEAFYGRAVEYLVRSGVPFMIGGAYAIREYARVFRETKDLDTFCLPDDCPRLLNALAAAGFATEVTDPLWLAKGFHGNDYIDIIFGSSNGLCWVDDLWFRYAREMRLFGHTVKVIPPEEMIWSKAYVQHRHRFDGPDIVHTLLHQGRSLDWQRLLARMDRDWELLLAHLLTFRFAYPSERDTIPAWLMDKLCDRVKEQLREPAAPGTDSRGWMLSPDYESDVSNRDARGPRQG